MTELRWRGYLIKHNRNATIAAYAKLAAIKALAHKDSVWRNFAAQVRGALNAEMADLFSALGIDPEYADTYCLGKDPQSAQYRYAGWYYFFGSVLEYGGMHYLGKFLFEFGTEFPDAPEPFRHESLIAAIDFQIALPWGLDEVEPAVT